MGVQGWPALIHLLGLGEGPGISAVAMTFGNGYDVGVRFLPPACES